MEPSRSEQDYEDFVRKFKEKPEHTTDDCITPPEVYDAVLSWVRERYGLPESARVLRPFYPGGDYENADYPEGAVVVDNPPFSISRRIIEFYNGRRVPYFLFVNGLTALSSTKLEEGTTTVFVGVTIKYDNGAEVNTAFATNLSPGCRIELSASLSQAVAKAQKRGIVRTKPPHRYSPGVVPAATLGHLARQNDIRIAEAAYIRSDGDYRVFGGAAVIDPKALDLIRESHRLGGGEDDVATSEKPSRDQLRAANHDGIEPDSRARGWRKHCRAMLRSYRPHLANRILSPRPRLGSQRIASYSRAASLMREK